MRKQLLGDLKDKIEYWKLKEEALVIFVLTLCMLSSLLKSHYKKSH